MLTTEDPIVTVKSVPDLPIGSIARSQGPSTFRGAPAKVYNIFNTVIGLSHSCCHNVL
jgi:hypothetical protein